MKYYVVDAFAGQLFKGNPAGVCICEKELTAEIMQKIAIENNLSETAFLYKKDNKNILRWFTPEYEIDLCGHATLATAYVMMNYIYPELNEIHFNTMSGELVVNKENDLYKMNFPSRMPVQVANDNELKNILGCIILETYQSRDLMVVVDEEETVQNLVIDFDLLKKYNSDVSFALIVTAKGNDCDFVSRFFAPNCGVNEDPVTGSAHCSLIPFWSNRLQKNKMTAKQLSKRGGTLYCENLGDRVSISGKAVCYLSGEIKI